MTTKLTLTIEKKIIDRAKKYAEQTGRSLSDLVESYLDSITKVEAQKTRELPEELRKLFGAVNISEQAGAQERNQEDFGK